MLMLSLSLELDFASLYDDCRTFFADETYTDCEESGYKDRNID